MARRRPPPPPPRRQSTTAERLRRLEARHREEERPFEPERQYPRETRPHHFAVNPAGWAWDSGYSVRVVVPGLTPTGGIGFPYLSGGWEAAMAWAEQNGVELHPGEPTHDPESLREADQFEPNASLAEHLAQFFQWLAEVNRLMLERSGEGILDFPEFAPEEAYLHGITPEQFVAEAYA